MLRGSEMSAEARAKMRAAKLGKPSNNRAWMAANRIKYGKSMPPSTRRKLRIASLANGSCPPSRKGRVPWNLGVYGDPRVVRSSKAARLAFLKKYPTKAARRALARKACKANRQISRVETRFLDAVAQQLKRVVYRQIVFSSPRDPRARYRVDGIVQLPNRKLVAIEVDGSAYWHRNTAVHQLQRDRSLRARGVAVIRVSPAQLRDYAAAIRRVVRFVRQKEG